MNAKFNKITLQNSIANNIKILVILYEAIINKLVADTM